MFELPTGAQLSKALSTASPMLMSMGQNLLLPPQQRDPNAATRGMALMMRQGEMQRRQEQEERQRAGLAQMLGTGQQPGGQQPSGQQTPQGPSQPSSLSQMISPQVAQMLSLMPPNQAIGTLAEIMTRPDAQGTSAMQEYEFARTQGFDGTLLDFVNSRAAAGRPVSSTTINMPGQRSDVWGPAPDDRVWLRDPQGNVITEPDPSGRGVRPVSVPVVGSDAEIETQEREAAVEEEIARAQQMLESVEGVLEDPALDNATGLWSVLQRVPGTGAYRFGTRARQLEGQAFLRAFDSLKGGGQITEVEGRKATEAIGRLDTAQSADDYRDALQELRGILQSAVNRQQQRLPGAQAEPTAQQPQAASTVPPRPSDLPPDGNWPSQEDWDRMTPDMRALFQ